MIDIVAPELSKETDLARRTISEPARVVVIRVIFEAGLRKWQFAWNGVRISAPILDQDFIDQLKSHAVEIGRGDALAVDLRITQVRDPDTNVYLSKVYEIAKVHGHGTAPEQQTLDHH